MIDAFAHFYPPPYMERLFALGAPLPIFVERVPSHEDANFRIAELDKCEIAQQVIALGTPAFDELVGGNLDKATELARVGNDGIAEVVAAHPDRFIGAATLPLLNLNSLEAALDELQRCVKTLGFKGVQIYTRAGEASIDARQFDALWERVTALDVPVLLHPTGGMEHPLARDYMLWLTFGWPYETSLIMLRMVYGGVAERFPSLKILTHHLGAFIPLMAERIKGVNFTLERKGGSALPEPLVQTLKRFYGDTAVNGYMPALEAGRSFFGAEHILFGTDYPYVPMLPQRNALVNWQIPENERVKMAETNARALFKLE